MIKKYTINTIPGDGIGKEVIPVSIKILEKLSEKFGFHLQFKFFDYSCDYYLKYVEMMDKDGLKKVLDCDPILLGAVGIRNVQDHVSL